MTSFDIDGLSEDELIALNKQIVDRLQFLQAQRTASAMQDLKIGSGVSFDGPDGVTVRGFVIRRNRKTVTVHDEADRQWTVSPALLKLTGKHLLDEAAEQLGNILAFAKPGKK